MLYRRAKENPPRKLTPGQVYIYGKGIKKRCLFLCPCGEREIDIAEETVSFNNNGFLTAWPYIGISQEGAKKFGKCHLQFMEGRVKKSVDTECSAKSMSGILKTKETYGL